MTGDGEDWDQEEPRREEEPDAPEEYLTKTTTHNGTAMTLLKTTGPQGTRQKQRQHSMEER